MSEIFVPLGVTKDYCPNWMLWECVREMVQNGLDAEQEKGAPLSIQHKGRTLTITNSGTLLPREAMMLGLSSKRQNEELIGEHGEGLKVGALAGVRVGAKITITTGDEVWTPDFRFYPGYQAETFGFVIKTSKRKPDTDSVVVKIEGVSAEDWFTWQSRFLNLPGAKRIPRVSCSQGDLLNDPAYAGRIYVKGVFVTHRAGMDYGYNFRRLKLDRDRQVIDSHDLYAAAAEVFNGVGMQDKGWARRLYGILARAPVTSDDPQADNREGRGLDGHTWRFDQELRTEIAKQFITEHGEGAVAVMSDMEAQEAKSAGLRPVQVSPSLRNVVASVYGSAAEQKKRMAKEVKTVHAPEMLTPAEREVLLRALALLGGTVTDFKEHVEVVDFHLPETRVLASLPSDQVKYLRVARQALADLPKLVVAVAKALAAQKPGLLELLLEESLRRELAPEEPLAAVA